MRRSTAHRIRTAWLGSMLLLAAGTAAAQRVDVRALDAYIAKSRTDFNVPGLSVGIVKDGKVVLAKGYGVRELGSTAAVDESTLFAIASNSKAFTATALGMLVDSGLISWDDRVRAHIPGFALYDPWVSDEVRVRDLLSHRVGLRTFGGDLLWYGTGYERDDVVERIRFMEQTGPFRSSYGYSNVSFITAGEIVPAVTGMSWDAFVERHILDPLGMTRTVTSVDSLRNRSNVATPHGLYRGELIAFPWRGWDAMAAGGGIISSAAEMASWMNMQLGGGELNGRRYLSDAAQRQMWTPHMCFTVSRQTEQAFPGRHFSCYGLGWGLSDYKGRKMVSHGGAYDGMYSQLVLVPAERLGLVVLSNSMTPIGTALAYRILDAYLGGAQKDWSAEVLANSRRHEQGEAERRRRAIQPPPGERRPHLPLAAYTGTYGGDLYGDATVTLDGGRLVLRLLPAEELVADLSHLSGDLFLLDWRARFPWFDRGTVQFVVGQDGSVSELKIEVPNEDFWFDELEFRRRDGETTE